jgi:hypothetical protein
MCHIDDSLCRDDEEAMRGLIEVRREETLEMNAML